MGVMPLVRAEVVIVMLASFRRRDEIALLAQVVGSAHANESALGEVVFLFRAERDGVDEHGQVVGVAADDLDELIFGLIQRFVVDAAGVFLAEAVFAALSDETAAVAGVAIINFF